MADKGTWLMNQFGGQQVTVDTVGARECLDVFIGGGIGFGALGIQVRSAANVWTDVGYFAGNLYVPVNIMNWPAFMPSGGTDRYLTATTASVDESNRALHSSEVIKDIWSDDYLLWFDDMETKSGGGLTANKWLPALNEPPFNVANALRHYDEGVLPDGQGGYWIPPKEGNWMLLLYDFADQQPAMSAGDVYTKLGEIDNKRVSFEVWWTLAGTNALMDEQSDFPYTPFAMGFYQFSPDAVSAGYNERIFIVRLYKPGLNVPAQWEYYDAFGAWVPIALDDRQWGSCQFGLWGIDDHYCWHYSKITINLDYEDDGTYNYEGFTVDDTYYPIDAPCNDTYIPVISPALLKSGLLPYLYGEFKCDWPWGEGVWKGMICFDMAKVYCNDLVEYNAAPATYGQKLVQG